MHYQFDQDIRELLNTVTTETTDHEIVTPSCRRYYCCCIGGDIQYRRRCRGRQSSTRESRTQCLPHRVHRSYGSLVESVTLGQQRERQRESTTEFGSDDAATYRRYRIPNYVPNRSTKCRRNNLRTDDTTEFWSHQYRSDDATTYRRYRIPNYVPNRSTKCRRNNLRTDDVFSNVESDNDGNDGTDHDGTDHLYHNRYQRTGTIL